ncbi:acyl-ACP--UDP-N-acetylglucosamine O-acyltransferase [bacterium]|nr:MAG: acyl-ACP--UDP-N-acetylglucosamine O-acyltransferase [bacterium]
MKSIHPTAIVSTNSQIEPSVTVGPFSIIEENVSIGAGTEISSHVRIEKFTRIGGECKIFNGAVVGAMPQDLKFKGEHSVLEIGDRTIIREFVTISRGTAESGKTLIGSDCLLMNYVHVAHDCKIGDHIILSNSVTLAGHIEIQDHAAIGGLVPVHQFVRIGKHAFVGGGYRVAQDVPPYILAAGEPLKFSGLNYVGLKRNNFSEEQIKTLEKVYYIIYQSHLKRSDALTKIKNEMEMSAEVKTIIYFFENSERGVIK